MRRCRKARRMARLSIIPINRESPLNCNIMLDRSGMIVHYHAYEQTPPEKRAQALQMMAEGISLRAITRLTGISRTTLIKLLEDAGRGLFRISRSHAYEPALQTATGRRGVGILLREAKERADRESRS